MGNLHLAESVAFVTGAGSGIGRAIALQLCADGVEKVVLVDVNETTLFETVAMIKARYEKANCATVVANVCDEKDAVIAVKRAVEQFDRIDYCINAAGIAGPFMPTGEQSTDSLDRVLSVNLRGLWLCERAEINQFMKQELRPLSTTVHQTTRGCIVNISSVLGTVAMPLCSPYNMAKHGVLGLTKTDAIDYAEAGIRVLAVCPGFCRTNLVNSAEWDALDPVIDQTPMKRLGTAEEIAFSVSFLASDRSSYTTGIAYCIDGGFTCK